MPATIVTLLSEDYAESMKVLTRTIADAVGAVSCRLALIDSQSKQLVVAATVERVEGAPEGTAVTVALNHEGRSLGMLTAVPPADTDAAHFTEQLEWVSDIAAQAVKAMLELAAEHDIRTLLESFDEVTRALVATSSSSESDALTLMLDQLWRVIRYDSAAVVLLAEDVLEVETSRGGTPGKRVSVSDILGLQAALGSRVPVALQAPHEVLPALGLPAGELAIVAPLFAKEVAIGAFLVGYRKKSDVGDRQTKLLERYAAHGGLFVDAERLMRRERSARGRAAALSKVSRTVATTRDRSALMQAAAEQLLEFSDADRAILYEGHARNAILIPRSMAGVEPAEAERAQALRLNLEDEHLAPLVQARVPVLLEDWQGIKNATPFAKTSSLLLVPMLSRDVLTGAIALAKLETPGHFDGVQIELLSSLAQQFALGLENARLFGELARMATTDEMTKLANRRSFIEVSGDWLRSARLSDESLAFLLLDMDHLKKINDTHGHAVGDAAIEHVGSVLRKRRGERELPARLGGEEFAVALRGLNIDEAHEVAEEIRGRLANTFLPQVGMVTASIGVAAYPADGATPSELLKAADQRLYRAKASGRNQVCSSMLPATIPPTPGEFAETPSR